MRLSSAGLLLILVAAVMIVFADFKHRTTAPVKAHAPTEVQGR